ncbi:MAG: hypothetical protein ISEC1_P0124 [Thiomicrorhabdus sp.]|nr:MAG: hypothetical protein ISEC1_P0124 [Thiomicrorhabdus sp.]
MSSEIKLPENLTIHHIEDHFNSLNNQFNDASGEITIEASAVETIDTAGLQSLLILIKNVTENSNTVIWQNTPDTIKTSADKIGLTQALNLS